MTTKRKFIPKRVEILIGSGAGYFKKGQFGYAIGDNRDGTAPSAKSTYPVFAQDTDTYYPGDVCYLVSKTKEMKGGAVWYSKRALRFTARSTGRR